MQQAGAVTLEHSHVALIVGVKHNEVCLASQCCWEEERDGLSFGCPSPLKERIVMNESNTLLGGDGEEMDVKFCVYSIIEGKIWN